MSIQSRWERVRPHLRWQDLAADAIGKFSMGVGVGALLAGVIHPYGWCFVGSGAVLVALVKGRYWKHVRGS